MADSKDQAFQQIDAEKIKEEVKTEAIKAATDSLISKLQGDKPRYSWEEKGKSAPSDYDELFKEVDKRVPKITTEDIEKTVEEKLKARDEAERQRLEDESKKQFETIEQSRKAFDSDWYALVQEGKMPAVAPELQERINKGDKIAKEEIMADEGLKARLELFQLSQGKKSAKLAFYEDYQNREPAGMNAPVLGGRTKATQSETKELEYNDVASNRKKIFGF